MRSFEIEIVRPDLYGAPCMSNTPHFEGRFTISNFLKALLSLEVKNLVIIPKNSNLSKFKDFLLQKHKNWDLTENVF